MTLLLLSGPAEGPVTLATLRTYLRVDGTEDDQAIQLAFRAARQHITRQTGYVLAVESWRLILDAWPNDQTVKIPLWPLRRITAARLYTGTGSASSISSTNIVTRSNGKPAFVRFNNVAKPAVDAGGIEIDCECGYASSNDVPQALTLAVMRITALLYETRGDTAALLQDEALNRLLSPFLTVRLT